MAVDRVKPAGKTGLPGMLPVPNLKSQVLYGCLRNKSFLNRERSLIIHPVAGQKWNVPFSLPKLRNTPIAFSSGLGIASHLSRGSTDDRPPNSGFLLALNHLQT
jgi:hypothetical protein